MSIQDFDQAIRPGQVPGSHVRDMLWALAMSAVSLGLIPILAFYVLLVN